MGQFRLSRKFNEARIESITVNSEHRRQEEAKKVSLRQGAVKAAPTAVKPPFLRLYYGLSRWVSEIKVRNLREICTHVCPNSWAR